MHRSHPPCAMSYIDALEFKEPRHLAGFLKTLDPYDVLYDQYFNWKKDFIVEAGVEQMARHAFCDLCAKLHSKEERGQKKSYSNLMPLWGHQSQCKGAWNESTSRGSHVLSLKSIPALVFINILYHYFVSNKL